MKRFETVVIKNPAVRIVFNIDGNVDYYSKTFLNIYNNVKCFSSVFYQLRNYYDNRIELIVNEDDEKDVIEYLEGFNGSVISIKPCVYIELFPEDDEFDKIVQDFIESGLYVEMGIGDYEC